MANSLLLAAPFAGLLLSIALVPLVAPSLWHRYFGTIVAFWSVVFLAADAAVTGLSAMLHSFVEALLLDYLPFILVLAALFAIAGGLRITGTPRGTPAVNTAMLAFGAVIASIIGTTGAAMMMIRPVIRANRHRRRRAHIVIFFIFLVANVGGALTPLGDPPLFLGYLAGVPFSWPLVHLAAPTALTAGGLLATFYAFDSYVHRRAQDEPALMPEIEKLGIEGAMNLPLLAFVVAAALLHGIWHPAAAVNVLGVKWGVGHIAADLIFVLSLVLSLRLTPARLRLENGFRWTPMIEVAVLFVGIFITLIPINAMIAAAASGSGAPLRGLFFNDGVPRDLVFFWATGLLSAVLDNAPTYLVFFGVAGGDAAVLAGPMARTLEAIAAGAVFCGALTYIGNAPNFMVKALAESEGIAMPGFFIYMVWASLCLLPWLLLVQMIFFS